MTQQGTPNPANGSPVSRAFLEEFNDHGYVFQYSVLRLAQLLFDSQRSPWQFMDVEIPGEVHGETTRIDFVLRHRSWPWYIIAECKRPDPALANWCFAHAPYPPQSSWPVVTETVRWQPEIGGSFFTYPSEMRRESEVYQVGVVVKDHNQRGYGKGSDRDAIEKGASQLCRSLNGFVHLANREGAILRGNPDTYLLPVLFTAARLWTTAADLGSADVRDGRLVNLQSTPAPWIYFEYRQSPHLLHGLPTAEDPQGGPQKIALDPFRQAIRSRFTRTLAIASGAGIEAFLTDPHWGS